MENIPNKPEDKKESVESSFTSVHLDQTYPGTEEQPSNIFVTDARIIADNGKVYAKFRLNGKLVEWQLEYRDNKHFGPESDNGQGVWEGSGEFTSESFQVLVSTKDPSAPPTGYVFRFGNAIFNFEAKGEEPVKRLGQLLASASQTH